MLNDALTTAATPATHRQQQQRPTASATRPRPGTCATRSPGSAGSAASTASSPSRPRPARRRWRSSAAPSSPSRARTSWSRPRTAPPGAGRWSATRSSARTAPRPPAAPLSAGELVFVGGPVVRGTHDARLIVIRNPAEEPAAPAPPRAPAPARPSAASRDTARSGRARTAGQDQNRFIERSGATLIRSPAQVGEEGLSRSGGHADATRQAGRRPRPATSSGPPSPQPGRAASAPARPRSGVGQPAAARRVRRVRHRLRSGPARHRPAAGQTIPRPRPS